MNYYNENDPKAAQWLRNLMDAGHIPSGEVDSRSITDVTANDLKGFTQCHFFAGVAGWPLALQLAGWPPARPVWTGSCPCQSFSTAGRREGFNDPRHLWPVWFGLIRQCRPAIIFGEQVDAAIRHGWLDLVFDDLESQNYTCGAAVLPAASAGAPHIRQRLWFMAYLLASCCTPSFMDNSIGNRREPGWAGDHGKHDRLFSGSTGENGALADSYCTPCKRDTRTIHQAKRGKQLHRNRFESGCNNGTADAYHSGWESVDWIYCRDGFWRPVEPGAFPLDHGVPARVVKLRAYGNAIVPQIAAEMIKAGMLYMDSIQTQD